MQNTATLSRFRALCAVMVLLVAGRAGLKAQAAPESSPAKPLTAEELSQAELLKAYMRVQEQLHAAQLAVVNNRIEAESTARAQAAAITEKLDAIKVAMAAERERQQVEAQRLAAERERQQLEAERSNHAVIWVAAIFGSVGLLAIFVVPLLQWRAINRMAEVSIQRPQLAAPTQAALMAADATAPSDHAVALSNQRLMSVIERMERRIFELEHTAVTPLASGSANGKSEPDSPRPAAPVNDQEAWISVLLGKARSLQATAKSREAVTCYDEILKLEPNHTEALIKKGAALERLKQDNEAIRCYDRAIAVNRNMTLAYLYKGGVCTRLQRYEEALECYEHALRAEEEAKA